MRCRHLTAMSFLLSPSQATREAADSPPTIRHLTSSIHTVLHLPVISHHLSTLFSIYQENIFPLSLLLSVIIIPPLLLLQRPYLADFRFFHLIL